MAVESVEIVSGTRLPPAEFMQQAPLGVSLRRLRHDRRIQPRIFADNRVGLSTIYNQAIDAAEAPDNIVFVHDDVWIDDIFLAERLNEALDRFDIVGVAGNRRSVPGQVKWHVLPDAGDKLDFPHLSGRLAHERPLGPILNLGETPAACELLDGVFIAARRSSLKRAGVRFDPAFDFHFYDLDFCRTARAKGLSIGTWPIVLTHRSWGAFDTPAWTAKRELYLAKWPA